MTESDFIARWEAEQCVYDAWGKYVLNEITLRVETEGLSPSDFFKIPPTSRVKDTKSLVDKAFYRPEKSYTDPYHQIEDKVGARFVVLLLGDIDLLCRTIEQSTIWNFDPCKHFNKDREKSPLLFTYQSVHYVLRPREPITHLGVSIPESTPCEVQIRTLLQHAHAELTHDAIYKSKRTIRPEVQRTVAKSMALIETTDDFFVDVTKKLNHGPLEEHLISEQLDALYLKLVGIKPQRQKSSIAIWDAFEQFLDSNLISKISDLMSKKTHLSGSIKDHINNHALYRQSIILFVYWLLSNKKRRLLSDWPLPNEYLSDPANDLGVSLFEE